MVTGGNSGIGLAMARALGLAGATVIIAARRRDRLAEAIRQLEGDAIAAAEIVVDLAETNGPAAAMAELSSRGLAVDILVNAAGMNLRQPFEDVTAEQFDAHVTIHLRAPFQLVQLLAPEMARRGWGRIINLASLQSQRAFANSAPYGAAKGGIIQLTRAIAERWSASGVTCNAIAPGFFPTELTAPVFADPEQRARRAADTAIGRNGELADLHGATVFFASDASGYVTGQTLFVDGGYSAK
jgi:gluconate 5-dehydrogenase